MKLARRLLCCRLSGGYSFKSRGPISLSGCCSNSLATCSQSNFRCGFVVPHRVYRIHPNAHAHGSITHRKCPANESTQYINREAVACIQLNNVSAVIVPWSVR